MTQSAEDATKYIPVRWSTEVGELLRLRDKLAADRPGERVTLSETIRYAVRRGLKEISRKRG